MSSWLTWALQSSSLGLLQSPGAAHGDTGGAPHKWMVLAPSDSGFER